VKQRNAEVWARIARALRRPERAEEGREAATPDRTTLTPAQGDTDRLRAVSTPRKEAKS
jgi:hypothetical protein